MNTSALKTFAPAVRRRLMDLVARKLDYVLSVPTPDYRTTYDKQVKALRELERTGRDELVERVAYTWFNRFAALRFLDARGWHPFRARVLTASAGETLPELLATMRSGALPDELIPHANVARLTGLLDGTVRSDNAQGELYRDLVLAACHYYHKLLPDVFEKLDDETELLLPDDLLTAESVVQGFRTEISDADCETVEVLGWLYQFYIAEKKDTVMARKSAVPTEDIPAVTQLFTPHWIVRYLVENSLGRLWLLNRPNSRLRDQMPYYIEGEPETDFLKIAKPEDIRLLDPACGSGHMLTYAFDLLYAIYEEEGYAPSEIPAHILRNNLHGLDICPRAAQLAEMALTFKAREKARRWFQQADVQPNVMALQDLTFTDEELRDYIQELKLGALFNQPMIKLLRQFEQATTFGSLIQPCLDERSIAFARAEVERKDLGHDLFRKETHAKVLRALRQAEMLCRRYQVVVANPPYMSNKGMIRPLADLAAFAYPSSKSDLFSMFIQRSRELAVQRGWFGMVTMQSWMFLASFEQLRAELLADATISSLLHLGPHAFDSIGGEVVQTCAFVFEKHRSVATAGAFVKLVDGRSEGEKEQLLKEVAAGRLQDLLFKVDTSDFAKVTGCPISYWISAKVRDAFQNNPPLSELAETKAGLTTGDNVAFQRGWHEVSYTRIGFNVRTRSATFGTAARWFPCNSGGSFRKWYGNNEAVVDWQNDGERIRNLCDANGRKKASTRSTDFYFKPGVTWNKIGGGAFTGRQFGVGFVFDDTGQSAFPFNEGEHQLLTATLCSSTTAHFMSFLSQTLSFNKGDVARVPLPMDRRGLDGLAASAVEIARTDWDNFETSWDFTDLPLLRPGTRAPTLATTWANWDAQCRAAIARMQALETENNRLFIAAYGLQDELSPEVPEDQITLARADQRKDVAAFLSYAVGCMMGRYSLDKPGLILADAGDTLAQYVAKVGKNLDALTFAPDEDGIIPLLDGEWFADDVVARTREFLSVTFGDAVLRENIRFIEDALGKDLRKYFLTDFYKDHLQTYKKRPIYWLVQSPKKGFGALVYLHRYTRDTLNVVLNRYLREYEVKLRTHLQHLERQKQSANVQERTAAGKEYDKLAKTLLECEEWERQTLLPKAQERIELDLDDGVKVNYLKLGDAMATIPGLAAAED